MREYLFFFGFVLHVPYLLAVKQLLCLAGYSVNAGELHSLLYSYEQSAGSAVSVVTTLQTGRPGFDSRQGRKGTIYLLHRFQTVSEVRPASYPLCTGGYFHGDKATGA